MKVTKSIKTILSLLNMELESLYNKFERLKNLWSWLLNSS